MNIPRSTAIVVIFFAIFCAITAMLIALNYKTSAYEKLAEWQRLRALEMHDE